MAAKYLLGVDIGTSGSKGVLVDLAGKVIAHKSAEHAVDTPKPGWYEHDADQIWWEDLKKIIRGLIAEAGVEPSEIGAVGVSALCPEMLPVDEDGRPLRKGILYCDGRAQKQIDDLVRLLGAERIAEMSANVLSSHFVGPKILWFRENEPALFERTHKIYSAASYLCLKLTGSGIVDFLEASNFSPLFNVQQLDWDEDTCAELGIARELLPEIRATTDIAGEVTSEAAEETGLAPGTPVITGTCDAFAEAVSVGVVSEGEASLLYGTTMVFVLIASELRMRPGMMVFPGVMQGTVAVAAGMSASAALTTWFRDNFGQIEKDVEERLGINAYQLLSQEAATVPAGAEGLVVLPYFAGERAPIFDAHARGMILGLTLSHTRRHIYRALLEGVAYALRHNLDLIEESGAQIGRIISTGGGTKSRLWTQIVSDVIGKEQEIATNPYGAPYGDAFLAGYGAGIFKDLSPLRKEWAPPTVKITPNPEMKTVYDKYYAVYRDLYEKNKDSMHTLAQLGMGE